MRFFGSYTITFDGSDLGDTFGGVSFTFHHTKKILEAIGTTEFIEWLTSLEGVIHQYEFSAYSVSSGSLKDGSVGTLVLTGTDHKITINNCQLLYPAAITSGIQVQKSFDLNFVACIDSTISSANPLFKIETP